MPRGRTVTAWMVAASAVAVLGGCSGDDAPPPPAAAPTPSSSPEATPDPPPSPVGAAGVDCTAVEAAGRELTDATNAELERLGIDRSDPRAFPVQLLVTGQGSAEYWRAVRDALPDGTPTPATPATPPDGVPTAELRSAADTVLAYWESLDARLDAIEIEDGSETAVQAATRRYEEIGESSSDEPVHAAQLLLTAGLDEACGSATAAP